MFNTSNALGLIVAFWAFHIISHVSAQYPKCYGIDTSIWPHADYSSIEGASSSGIPISVVRERCQEACRADSVTFCGITRNGDFGGRARCYCGDTLQKLSNSNTCSHMCGGGTYICGHYPSESMSVYTVCEFGKYGATCTDSCPVNCFEDVCQVSSGVCHIGCEAGWYGGTCTQSCVNCNNGCTQTDGKCQPGGCKSGFHGEKCDQTCPVNCGGTDCMQSNGECNSCDLGYHGKYCDQSCSNCMEGCGQDDGICKAGGCKSGFHGSKCDLSCPNNCQDGRCRQDDGVCDSCDMGYHGDNCDKVCNCLNGCQQASGICESGGCVQGYFGEKCDMSCPNCDGGCQENNGSCTAGCQGGYHGDKCDMSCPNCNGGCQQDTGFCTWGCLDGYHGDKCDMDCSDGCFDGLCFIVNGVCTSCKLRFYSNICDLSCSSNCKENGCDFKDGSCILKGSNKSTLESWVLPVASVLCAVLGIAVGIGATIIFQKWRQSRNGMNKTEHTIDQSREFELQPDISAETYSNDVGNEGQYEECTPYMDIDINRSYERIRPK